VFGIDETFRKLYVIQYASELQLVYQKGKSVYFICKELMSTDYLDRAHASQMALQE
jgi:hypothetical protein